MNTSKTHILEITNRKEDLNEHLTSLFSARVRMKMDNRFAMGQPKKENYHFDFSKVFVVITVSII